MTPEDEEFNRIEREAAMRKEVVKADELHRVNQENEELRQALARMSALYEKVANQRDALFENHFTGVIRDKLREKNA